MMMGNTSRQNDDRQSFGSDPNEILIVDATRIVVGSRRFGRLSNVQRVSMMTNIMRSNESH